MFAMVSASIFASKDYPILEPILDLSLKPRLTNRRNLQLLGCSLHSSLVIGRESSDKDMRSSEHVGP